MPRNRAKKKGAPPRRRKGNRPKVLVFIVAYNAESTLLEVLDRIPEALFELHPTEVLVIDDASQDRTFEMGQTRARKWKHCTITILQNPKNQGYGGNQKLGYEYAIKNGFDIVALLHGDGQYAPEMLPALVEPIARGDADAVFGSRMMVAGDALKGGMPFYKWLGNKVLTTFQNTMLEARLTEFHSGYRVYSVAALKQIPFQYNSNDFHFDTDIIIQLLMAGLRIEELPIPTYYGDEICYVDGMKYAKDVAISTLESRVHRMGLQYQRRFDVEQTFEEHYDLKLGYASSHTMAIDAVPAGARVLDLGCGPGLIGRELLAKGCEVVGLDIEPPDPANVSRFIRWDLNQDTLPEEVFEFDYILMLDILEHLKSPETLLDVLRRGARTSCPTLIITAPNVAFFIVRSMLMLGQFNYGKNGILDFGHTRLFTFASLSSLLEQSGFEIIDVQGIPAPFVKAVGNPVIGRAMSMINDLLIKASPTLFSYQSYFVARPLPTVDNLLEQTLEHSRRGTGG